MLREFYSVPAFLALFVACYVGYIFLVAIHEFGHWFCARAFGLKITEFRCTFIRWRVKEGWGLHFRWGMLFSGIVKAVFREADRNLRLRYFLFSIAGPVATLLGAGIFCALMIHLPQPINGAATLLFIASMVIVGATLFPASSGDHRSDGFRMAEALFNTKSMRLLRKRVEILDQVHTLSELRKCDDSTAFFGRVREILLLMGGDKRYEKLVVQMHEWIDQHNTHTLSVIDAVPIYETNALDDV